MEGFDVGDLSFMEKFPKNLDVGMYTSNLVIKFVFANVLSVILRRKRTSFP